MLRTEKSRDAGERGHCPCPFISGATGTEVPFHRSIMGNCMVYQDRLETYLLAATPRNFRVVFCNLSVIIFVVNIVAEQKQALLVTIFCFSELSLPSALLLPYRQGVTGGAKFPGRRMTAGRRRKVPTMSQVLFSIQYICFRKISGSNMGAPNLLLAPGAV